MEEKGDTKTGKAYYDENGKVRVIYLHTRPPTEEEKARFKGFTEVEFKYNNSDDMRDKAQAEATAHKNLLANPPPSMGSPEQIAEAKEFGRIRAAEQKPAQPPEKKSGTATVYYSATGDIDGVSFDGKHYFNESIDSDHPILVSVPIAVRAEISKEFQFTNITPHKLLQELASKAQEAVNNARKQQAPQAPAERERQSSKSSAAPAQPEQAATPTTTPPLVNPAKGRRGLPGQLSAKPTYDPNALKKKQPPQPVVQQKVEPQPAQPATTSTSKPAVDNDSKAASTGSSSPRTSDPSSVLSSKSGVSGGAKPSVSNNGYYKLLDNKYDDINTALKDCTLVKEDGTYHIRNATSKSDIIVNQDGSMRGESHTVNNKDDLKVIADKISADLVIMAKVHQASGNTEPLHLEVIKGEKLSDEQSIKMMQIERLVQHNLEREFNEGNKNGLDKSKFTFAGKPIPPLAPPVLPVEQKAVVAARGNATPKRDEGMRPHK